MTRGEAILAGQKAVDSWDKHQSYYGKLANSVGVQGATGQPLDDQGPRKGPPPLPTPGSRRKQEREQYRQERLAEIAQAEANAKKAEAELPKLKQGYQNWLDASNCEDAKLWPTQWSWKGQSCRKAISDAEIALRRPAKLRASFEQFEQSISPEFQSLLDAWNDCTRTEKAQFMRNFGVEQLDSSVLDQEIAA